MEITTSISIIGDSRTKEIMKKVVICNTREVTSTIIITEIIKETTSTETIRKDKIITKKVDITTIIIKDMAAINTNKVIRTMITI